MGLFSFEISNTTISVYFNICLFVYLFILFIRIEPTVNLIAISNIVSALKDLQTIVYFNDLKYILEHVTHLNELFQCQYLISFLVHTQVTKLYGTLLSDFLPTWVLSKCKLCNFCPKSSSNHKQDKEVYLGAENRLLLRK